MIALGENVRIFGSFLKKEYGDTAGILAYYMLKNIVFSMEKIVGSHARENDRNLGDLEAEMTVQGNEFILEMEILKETMNEKMGEISKKKIEQEAQIKRLLEEKMKTQGIMQRNARECERIEGFFDPQKRVKDLKNFDRTCSGLNQLISESEQVNQEYVYSLIYTLSLAISQQ